MLEGETVREALEVYEVRPDVKTKPTPKSIKTMRVYARTLDIFFGWYKK
jgi:hypothetical protein